MAVVTAPISRPLGNKRPTPGENQKKILQPKNLRTPLQQHFDKYSIYKLNFVK